MARSHSNKGLRPLRAVGPEGFLLIETLVSLAIIASVLVVVIRSFGMIGQAMRAEDRYFQASLLLGQKQWEVTHRPGLREGQRAGAFDQSPFRWREQVSRVPALDLMQVTLAIQWQDAAQRRELSTMLLVPIQ